MIGKGIVLSFGESLDRNDNPSTAKIQPCTAEGVVSMEITIPWYLRGAMGELEKGTEIVYTVFPDYTGIILSRMDGEWSGTIEEAELRIDLKGGEMNISEGNVLLSEELKVREIETPTGYYSTHKHGGIMSGTDKTQGPEGG